MSEVAGIESVLFTLQIQLCVLLGWRTLSRWCDGGDWNRVFCMLLTLVMLMSLIALLMLAMCGGLNDVRYV